MTILNFPDGVSPEAIPDRLGPLAVWLKAQLSPVCASPLQVQAESRLVLSHRWPDADRRVWTHPDEPVSDADRQWLHALLLRRLTERVPVQHLLGEAGFFGLTLGVSSAVLIPRPETERLVEAVLDTLPPDGVSPPSILDLGTGSGAIALALAHTLGPERSRLTASDVSPEALAMAQQNAARLGLADAIRWVLGDGLTPFRGERFDRIVSNPPYLDETDLAACAPEVAWHEPRGALVCPEGRLGWYFKLGREAPAHLVPGGWLLVEVGDGQAEEVVSDWQALGWQQVSAHPDGAGILRVVVGRRPG